MVNLALISGSTDGNQYGSIGHTIKENKLKDTYMLLRKNLTLLKLNNYEDYVLMDVVCKDENRVR